MYVCMYVCSPERAVGPMFVSVCPAINSGKTYIFGTVVHLNFWLVRMSTSNVKVPAHRIRMHSIDRKEKVKFGK